MDTDNENLDIDFDATFAALDALEAQRAARSPEAERAYLKTLGAPAWLTEDLSACHTCVSNDAGVCGRCAELGQVAA